MANGLLGLSIGKSALQSQQRALEVTSQNLANANSEGYARKVVTLRSMSALNLPDVQGPAVAAQIGTGVEVARIESVRDLRLNERIRRITTDLRENERKESVLDQVEALFAGEDDIAQSMDDFFSALDDLEAAPDSTTARAVVISRGIELTDRIRAASDSVENLRNELASEITDQATAINGITAELAQTNERIAAMTSGGMQGNDFEDRRQILLEQLARIGNVSTVAGPANTLTVLIAGQVVVQDFTSVPVVVQRDGRNGQMPILATGTTADSRLDPRGGTLEALYDLRDETLTRVRADLNELAVSLTQRFNEIHRTGFGLDGSTGVNFFTTGNPPTTEQRLYSVRSSVFVEEPGVALDGDTTTAQQENFEGNPVGSGAFVVNGRSISYNGAVDSLADIVTRINEAGAGVNAFITPQNRVVISGTRQSDYVISNMSDGGNLLARLGILPQGFSYPPPTGAFNPPTAVFTGTATVRPADDAARRFTLTDEVRANVNRIAAAQGEDISNPPDGIGDRSRGVGDGGNALLLATLREDRVMSNGSATFADYMTGVVGQIGVEAGASQRTVNGLEAQVAQLNQRREEIQGVSIDEELINLIRYQRGFEASARIITVADEILQTLLALGR